MRRPLCTICLAVILLVAVYTGLHPPETVSYETVSGRMVQVTGQVYAKEYQQGKEAPVLVLFLKPHELIFRQQKIHFQNNFICTMSSDREEPAIESTGISNHEPTVGNSVYSKHEPAIGSFVCMRGVLMEMEPASNPGQFDAKAYYATLGISARLFNCKILAESEDHDPVSEILWKVRRESSKLLYDIFPQEDASILSTMLLGDKSGLLKETKDLYKDGGILHILAISGLHISFLGMGLYKILRRLRIPVYVACVISGLLMIAYGIMVGMPVSAVRAVGMFIIRLMAVCLKRTYDMLTSLFFCGTLTVIHEPLLLYNTGFQLSYLAVLAILIMKPVIVPPVDEKMRSPNHEQGIIYTVLCSNHYIDGFLTTLSITIFLLPVQLSSFYEISLYSPILNLMILPLVGFVMAVGLLCIPLQIAAPFLAYIGALAVHFVLNAFAGGAEFLNHLPGAIWILGKPSPIRILIFYGVILVVLRLEKLRYKYKIGLLCGAILALTVRFESDLRVTFLDTGQGDCTVVELPKGQVWLIDGGSSTIGDVGTYRIEPFLKSRGIHTVDAVFLSHGDADHINGVEEMIFNGDIDIKMLVLPGTERDLRENVGYLKDSTELKASNGMSGFDKIIEEAGRQKIPIMWLESGMGWKSGEISVECLHPNKDFISQDSNACSQVLYLNYGQFSVLFTGDVEGEGENRVLQTLQQRGIKGITLLKVAHHGSQNSTSREFLEVIAPKYAVISCGKKNAYGHPHEAVLMRLSEMDVPIFYTMESGAVTFITDGKSLEKNCFLK